MARILAHMLVAGTAAVVLVTGGCGGADSDTPSERAATASPAGAKPPGELIAFERVGPDGEERDLYAVGADGGEPKLLNSPGDYPHWSPDGSMLAFNACLNPPECTTAVALLDRATGKVHGHLMSDPSLFTACVIWAPTGKTLACEGTSEDDPKRNGVYVIRASDGKGLKRVTSNPGGIDSPLAYSPDGDQLLLVRTKAGGSEEDQALFVTPSGGGRAHQITQRGYSDDYACWSPDGRSIVFGKDGALYRVGSDGHGLAEIDLKLPDGSPVQGPAFDVCFSPGGERIVFSLVGAGLYTARADGEDVKALTDGPADDHHANWGPAPDA